MSNSHDSPVRIKLTDARRERIIESIKRYYSETFDEDLSDFRTGELLDFFVAILGPAVYNQGVQDARSFMMKKLEDLEGDVYEPDRT